MKNMTIFNTSLEEAFQINEQIIDEAEKQKNKAKDSSELNSTYQTEFYIEGGELKIKPIPKDNPNNPEK